MKLKLIALITLAFLLLAACGKSDADIKTEAEKAVKDKAPNATVVVKDGVITLTGEAKDEDQKKAAEEAARVEGVTDVKNDMTVTPSPTPAVPDESKKKAVEDALAKKGLSDVEVTATTTEVILRGTVPTGKMGVAVMTATDAGGGAKVTNQLSEK